MTYGELTTRTQLMFWITVVGAALLWGLLNGVAGWALGRWRR